MNKNTVTLIAVGALLYIAYTRTMPSTGGGFPSPIVTRPEVEDKQWWEFWK